MLIDIEKKLGSLGRKINNLCSNFCCKVKDCLGISATGDASLVLNQQGDWVSNIGVVSVVAGLGIAVDATDPTAPIVSLDSPFIDDWIDYSATSTITGWSSFTSKQIFYKIMDDNKTMHVYFNLGGTSNSTTTKFTLPNALLSTFVIDQPIRTIESISTFGLATMTSASSEVSLSKDAARTAFLGTGTKSARGVLTIPIQ